MPVPVTELVGVYDADGGLLGEAAYLWGRLRGTRHCTLCDVTHSTLRRRPAWDEFVTRLGIGFRLLHLNELPDDIADLVTATGAPVVLARTGGEWQPLLTAEEIGQADGDVAGFERVLRSRIATV